MLNKLSGVLVPLGVPVTLINPVITSLPTVPIAESTLKVPKTLGMSLVVIVIEAESVAAPPVPEKPNKNVAALAGADAKSADADIINAIFLKFRI